MKKIITVIAFLISINCNAQDFIFGGNVTNQKAFNTSKEDVENIYGNFRFNFGITTQYLGFESSEVEFEEKIIAYDWEGHKLTIFTETSCWEIYHLLCKPIIVIERPYIGEVEYRQYYQSSVPIITEPLFPIKPMMSRG